MAEIKDPENTVIVTLKDGPVVIELLKDIAPKHVERMKVLARAGKYDNVAFHRVIDGFMAQTGDVEHANMEKGWNPGRAGTGHFVHNELTVDAVSLSPVPTLEAWAMALMALLLAGLGARGLRRQRS